ncbi:MAG: hypothetical protein KatS3mg113_0671 [Planctomycetaceae bacterium]|nr:MAG: hypothetical protein KatS3mg113_0671 [Planctomycetaceae bacterium]
MDSLGHSLKRLTVRITTIAGMGAGMLIMVSTLSGADDAQNHWPSAHADATAQRTAITLNYCRASFHRIRRNPSLRVLQEEQQKILNQLNLNGINDPEIIRLYGSVLDEMAAVQLAGRERQLLQDKYARQYRRDLSLSALALAAQVFTAQYAAAVRTGATSWWDFRTQTQNRELDLFRVEKERFKGFVDKSLQFLDITWKLARERNIPDRWLVRGDDLDRLEEAWQESDAQTRLRRLKRLEPFMECYPPYWYYLARTQQALGDWRQAAETYRRLEELATGHFRRDDMLAAGLANRAAILAFLGDETSVSVARQALHHSMDVWSANLLCASILLKQKCYAEAEEAIYRNLDASLERTNSQTALIGLLIEKQDKTRLAGMLSDPQIVRDLHPAVLMLAAQQFYDPPPLVQLHLQQSMSLMPRFQLGRDDLLVQAVGSWRLDGAQLRLVWGSQQFRTSKVQRQGDQFLVVFEQIAELNSWSAWPEFTLWVEYPDAPAVKVSWTPPRETQTSAGVFWAAAYRQPTLHVKEISWVLPTSSAGSHPFHDSPREVFHNAYSLPVHLSSEEDWFVTPALDLVVHDQD